MIKRNLGFITLALSLLACLISAYTIGHQRGLAVADQWQSLYEAQRERAEWRGERACICEPVITVYPDAGVITCLSDDPSGCR